MAEEWVDIDRASIWTSTSGAGVPLVLCHGGPVGYDYLEPVAKLIDDIALVHRFDQRGGGRTQSADPPSLETLVADLDALRAHWRHERWIVAGHSWGAHLALFYALAHPEHVLAVVFMNGPGIDWGWGPERDANRLAKLSPAEQREFRELKAASDPSPRLRELNWLTDFADRECARRHRPFDAYPRERALIAALERDWQAALAGIGARLADLHAPVLVVHGDADPIPAHGPRSLAEQLPLGEFILLKGVGHNPWLENPDDLRIQLRAFIARVATTG